MVAPSRLFCVALLLAGLLGFGARLSTQASEPEAAPTPTIVGVVGEAAQGEAAPRRWLHLPLVARQLPIAPPTPVPTATPIAPAFEERVLALVNEQRTGAGCAPLAPHGALARAAEGHSSDMALNDFFSHTGSDGSSPGDRIAAQGYNAGGWGENIAAGQSSPEQVVAAWMASEPHRANLLNCALRDAGVGYLYLAPDPGNVAYRHYWTLVLARP